MELEEHVRALIGSRADATLVTLNPDGSPQCQRGSMDDPTPGFITHIRIGRIGGMGPWAD